jgi:LmbE family N-acetylglucosaminyl deacetylase
MHPTLRYHCPMQIMLFVAHPDGETIFAGGLTALMAEHGAVVHMLLATRGLPT